MEGVSKLDDGTRLLKLKEQIKNLELERVKQEFKVGELLKQLKDMGYTPEQAQKELLGLKKTGYDLSKKLRIGIDEIEETLE